MKPRIYNENELDLAAAILKEGKLLVFPTETVFGIGCIYDQEDSFLNLERAKRRPFDKPVAMMCSSVEEAIEMSEPTDKQKKLMKKFLPGELTVLIRGKKDLPSWVTLGTGIVGIRVPDFPLAQNLLRAVGKPCLVSSANLAGELPLSSAEEAIALFDSKIGGAVSGHPVSSTPSTIVDLTGEEPRLVRQGTLSFAKIEEYWRSL